MRKISVVILLLRFIFTLTYSQELTLPNTQKPTWIMSDPSEVVTYLLFDTSLVNNLLPRYLNFVTVKDIANKGVSWAINHLKSNPNHKNMGISFLEIVNSTFFEIEGENLEFGSSKAIGIWFARVEVNRMIKTKGTKYLSLEFLVPDMKFCKYMSSKGYYSEYADVSLVNNEDNNWIGKIVKDNLNITVNFNRKNNFINSGSYSNQTIFYSKKQKLNKYTIVSFKGHRIFDCSNVKWTIKGKHPLSESIIIGETTFQTDYELIGSQYNISYE